MPLMSRISRSARCGRQPDMTDGTGRDLRWDFMFGIDVQLNG